ncbi:MAG: hypothetical protein R6V49_11445 [Bacteroidales bacterium]
MRCFIHNLTARPTGKPAAFIVVLLILFIMSCENSEIRNNACDPCLAEPPDSGNLIIQFSVNNKHIDVPYAVYLGDFEEGMKIHGDTARNQEVSIQFKADETYSVVAEYWLDGQKTLVVDGAKIKTRKMQCPDPEDSESTISCWYVIPGRIDVTVAGHTSNTTP